MKLTENENNHPLESLTDDQLTSLLEEQGIQYSEVNQQRINKKIKDKQMKSKGVMSILKERLNPRRGVLISCALVLLIPVTALAANKIWEVTTKQEGFLTTIGLSGKKVSDTPYKLSASYVPEGLVEVPNTDGQKYWKESVPANGFSLALIKPNKKDKYPIPYSEGAVEETVGDRPVYFIKRTGMANNDFTNIAMVLFEKEERLVEIYFGSGVSKEEQIKMIEGLELKETSKEKATLVAEMSAENYMSDPINRKAALLKKDSQNMSKVGQTFAVKVDGNEQTSEQLKVNVTVSGTSQSNQLPGFSEKAKSDYSGLLDEICRNNLLSSEGQLLAFDAKLYQRGDGVKTVDTLVESLKIQPVYREFQMQLTNTTDSETDDLYFAPMLHRMAEQANGYQEVDPSKYLTPVDYFSEPIYLNEHGEGKSYYNIGKLKAKETKSVTIGYISINPLKDLEMLNISMTGSDSGDLNSKDNQWITFDS